jgi:hypothetical protein
VGQQTRSPVRYCKDGGSTLHTQVRPQEAPPAKTHSQNQGRKRLRPIQPRGDMMAGSLHGRPADIQTTSRPVNEDGQGSRSPTARTHEDARNHPRASKSCPDRLRSSHHVKLKPALVGPVRDPQTKGTSTPAQSASWINSGRTPHDGIKRTDGRFRAPTRACSISKKYFRPGGVAPSELSETPRRRIAPCPASIQRVAFHIAL